MKLFYTGPFINAEMLVAMLDKHGIVATQSFVDPAAPDDGDLSRPAQVFVPEADSDRAYKFFTPSAKTNFDRKSLAKAQRRKVQKLNGNNFNSSRLCVFA